jgi:hypothetical protein
MEIDVARRPELVLRGMDRLFAVAAEAIPQATPRTRVASRVPARWLIERGETRVEAPVAALGGFPGALRAMNRLDDSRLICTLRYLVVGEGTSHGFAIPMRDVLSASVIRPDHRSNHGLAVWYRDGETTASFFLQFRGMSRGISGMRRAEQAMHFLVGRGVAPVSAREAQLSPAVHLSWDQAATLAAEEILWAGNGVASVGGWFGSTQEASRVWLTDRSLLWAGASQDGVNYLPLQDIIEARDGAGDRVSIGIRDALGHRYDVAFDLAPEQVGLDRQANPRVRFMNALASHGVSVGTASTPLAPWRAGSVVRPMDRRTER